VDLLTSNRAVVENIVINNLVRNGQVRKAIREAI